MRKLSTSVLSLFVCISMLIHGCSFVVADANGASQAGFVGFDTATKGDWVGAYGSAGYDLPCYLRTDTTIFGVADIIVTPSYVTNFDRNWGGLQLTGMNSNHAGALAYPDGTKGHDLCILNYDRYEVALQVNDNQAHVYSFYFFNSAAEAHVEQTIEIQDVNGNVLDTRVVSGMDTGVYATYIIKGSFKLVIKPITLATTVFSGMFIDEPVNTPIAGFLVSDSAGQSRCAELSWTAPGAGWYTVVERKSEEESGFSQIARVDGQLGSYQDTDLAPNTMYTYRILKRKGGTVSVYTPTQTIQTENYTITNITANPSRTIESTLGNIVSLQVSVKDADQTPLDGVCVNFRLGGQDMSQYIPSDIGSIMTDAAGNAALQYTTNYQGTFTVTAAVENDDIAHIQGGTVEIPLIVSTGMENQPPIIINASEGVSPGTLIRLNGSGLDGNINIAVVKNAGSSAQTPPADAISLEVVQKDTTGGGRFAVTKLPADAPAGIYDIWVQNQSGWSRPVKINRVRPMWISEYEVFAGQDIRIIGRNLNGEEFGVDTSYCAVRLKNVNSEQEIYPVCVKRFSPYDITFTVENVPLGTYTVEVRNDPAGEWVKTEENQTLTVVQAGEDPLNMGVAWAKNFRWDRQVNVCTKGAIANDGIDDTNAFCAAMSAVQAQGGGVVYIPDGTYDITSLGVEAGVVLMGESKDGTVLRCIGTDGFPFIYNTGDGIQVGRCGFANFSIDPVDSTHWPHDKYAFYFSSGHNANDSGIHGKTAKEIFLINLNTSTKFDGVRFEGKYGFDLDQRLYIRDCEIGSAGVGSINTYAYMANNNIGYANGATHMFGYYSIFENNVLNANANTPANYGKDAHGLSIRSGVFVYNNRFYNTGRLDYIHNDGESLLIENVNGCFDYGKILRADGLALEVESFGTCDVGAIRPEFGYLCVAIVGGRGLGQVRRLVSHSDNVYTIDQAWDIVPDRTSVYSLLLPLRGITAYRNTFRDCGGALSLYGNAYDDVIAENSLINSGGINVTAFNLPTRYVISPGYFVRITRNYLEDVVHTVRGEGNLTGLFIATENRYATDTAMGIEVRDNYICGVNSTNPGGLVCKLQDDYVRDFNCAYNVIFENNTLADLPTGCIVSNSISGVLLRNNKNVHVGTHQRLVCQEAIDNLIIDSGTGAGTTWHFMDENYFENTAWADAMFTGENGRLEITEAGTVHAVVKLFNNRMQPMEIRVIVALYQDGRLCRAYPHTVNLLPNSGREITQTIDVEQDYSIKVFAWDDYQSLKPLCGAFLLPASENV